MLRDGGVYVVFQLRRNVPVLFISQPDCICDLSDDIALRNRSSPTMHTQEMDDTDCPRKGRVDAVTVWRLAGCRRFYIREPRFPCTMLDSITTPLSTTQYSTAGHEDRSDVAESVEYSLRTVLFCAPRLLSSFSPVRCILSSGCREPVGPRAEAGTGVTPSARQQRHSTAAIKDI
jgi:hypothetical protein